MIITVEKNSEVIFEGEAEDFLFENENNEDLEFFLNELECSKNSTQQFEEYVITRENYSLYD